MTNVDGGTGAAPIELCSAWGDTRDRKEKKEQDPPTRAQRPTPMDPRLRQLLSERRKAKRKSPLRRLALEFVDSLAGAPSDEWFDDLSLLLGRLSAEIVPISEETSRYYRLHSQTVYQNKKMSIFDTFFNVNNFVTASKVPAAPGPFFLFLVKKVVHTFGAVWTRIYEGCRKVLGSTRELTAFLNDRQGELKTLKNLMLAVAASARNEVFELVKNDMVLMFWALTEIRSYVVFDMINEATVVEEFLFKFRGTLDALVLLRKPIDNLLRAVLEGRDHNLVLAGSQAIVNLFCRIAGDPDALWNRIREDIDDNPNVLVLVQITLSETKGRTTHIPLEAITKKLQDGLANISDTPPPRNAPRWKASFILSIAFELVANHDIHCTAISDVLLPLIEKPVPKHLNASTQCALVRLISYCIKNTQNFAENAHDSWFDLGVQDKPLLREIVEFRGVYVRKMIIHGHSGDLIETTLEFICDNIEDKSLMHSICRSIKHIGPDLISTYRMGVWYDRIVRKLQTVLAESSGALFWRSELCLVKNLISFLDINGGEGYGQSVSLILDSIFSEQKALSKAVLRRASKSEWLVKTLSNHLVDSMLFFFGPYPTTLTYLASTLRLLRMVIKTIGITHPQQYLKYLKNCLARNISTYSHVLLSLKAAKALLARYDLASEIPFFLRYSQKYSDHFSCSTKTCWLIRRNLDTILYRQFARFTGCVTQKNYTKVRKVRFLELTETIFPKGPFPRCMGNAVVHAGRTREYRQCVESLDSIHYLSILTPNLNSHSWRTLAKTKQGMFSRLFKIFPHSYFRRLDDPFLNHIELRIVAIYYIATEDKIEGPPNPAVLLNVLRIKEQNKDMPAATLAQKCLGFPTIDEAVSQYLEGNAYTNSTREVEYELERRLRSTVPGIVRRIFHHGPIEIDAEFIEKHKPEVEEEVCRRISSNPEFLESYWVSQRLVRYSLCLSHFEHRNFFGLAFTVRQAETPPQETKRNMTFVEVVVSGMRSMDTWLYKYASPTVRRFFSRQLGDIRTFSLIEENKCLMDHETIAVADDEESILAVLRTPRFFGMLEPQDEVLSQCYEPSDFLDSVYSFLNRVRISPEIEQSITLKIFNLYSDKEVFGYPEFRQFRARAVYPNSIEQVETKFDLEYYLEKPWRAPRKSRLNLFGLFVHLGQMKDSLPELERMSTLILYYLLRSDIKTNFGFEFKLARIEIPPDTIARYLETIAKAASFDTLTKAKCCLGLMHLGRHDLALPVLEQVLQESTFDDYSLLYVLTFIYRRAFHSKRTAPKLWKALVDGPPTLARVCGCYSDRAKGAPDILRNSLFKNLMLLSGEVGRLNTSSTFLLLKEITRKVREHGVVTRLLLCQFQTVSRYLTTSRVGTSQKYRKYTREMTVQFLRKPLPHRYDLAHLRIYYGILYILNRNIRSYGIKELVVYTRELFEVCVAHYTDSFYPFLSKNLVNFIVRSATDSNTVRLILTECCHERIMENADIKLEIIRSVSRECRLCCVTPPYKGYFSYFTDFPSEWVFEYRLQLLYYKVIIELAIRRMEFSAQLNRMELVVKAIRDLELLSEAQTGKLLESLSAGGN